MPIFGPQSLGSRGGRAPGPPRSAPEWSEHERSRACGLKKNPQTEKNSSSKRVTSGEI